MVKGSSEPIRSIRIEAPGAPGQRTFYLQAQLSGGDFVTRLLEKAQAMIIVDQIDSLLGQLARAYPTLPTLSMMQIGEFPALSDPEPVLFRAGQFALQYDPARDLVCFRVSELRGVGQGEPQSCQWWITRQQVSAFGEMARQVIASGLAARME